MKIEVKYDFSYRFVGGIFRLKVVVAASMSSFACLWPLLPSAKLITNMNICYIYILFISIEHSGTKIANIVLRNECNIDDVLYCSIYKYYALYALTILKFNMKRKSIDL